MVIFDCDGVLVDTEIINARVLSGCLAPLGVSLTVPEVLALFRGKPIAKCAEQVACLLLESEPYKSWPPAELASFSEDFWRHIQKETLKAFDAGVKPIEGVRELVQHLQDSQIPFCVASNGRHEKMEKSLTQAGLIQFFPRSVRFSATDVAEGKPAPDLFLLAARTLGQSPEDCLVVEDSVSGVEAARRAGMRVLGFCPEDPAGQTAGAMRQQGALIICDMSEVLSQL